MLFPDNRLLNTDIADNNLLIFPYRNRGGFLKKKLKKGLLITIKNCEYIY